MFSVKWDKKSEKIWKLIEEWPERAAKVGQLLARSAAVYIAKDVVSKIPAASENKEYLKSIRVAKITGLPEGVAGFAVFSKPRSKKISKLDSSTSLLYVVPTRNLITKARGTQVLVDYGPWTVNTLPFHPSRHQAHIVSRTVTEAQVSRREKQLSGLRAQYMRDLTKAGVRVKGKIASKKRGKAVPDTSATGAALEFGDMAQNSKPHWKPSIIKFMRGTLPILPSTDSRYIKAFTKPAYREWRTWPASVGETISSSETKVFSDFWKRLGLKW